MDAPIARPFPFWRSLGLFLGACVAAFFAMFVGAMVVYAVAAVSGNADAVTAQLRNPASVAFDMLGVCAYATIAGLIVWLYPKLTHRPWSAMGFRALRAADAKPFALGLATLIIARIALTWYLSLSHQTEHVQTGFDHFRIDGLASTVLTVFVIVLLGPFAEELLFRAVLFGALAERMPMIVAAVISSAIFGVCHGDPVLFPFIALLGIVNAVVYARTGSIVLSMLLHALNNALPIAVLIATGS